MKYIIIPKNTQIMEKELVFNPALIKLKQL